MRSLIRVAVGVALVVFAVVSASTAFGSHATSSFGEQRTVCRDSGWPSSAQGLPAALRGTAQGYFLWHDVRGWHLRLRAGSTGKLEGNVSANARIRVLGSTPAARLGLKAGASGFSFRLSGTGKGEGIDFAAACARRLTLNFGGSPASGAVASGAPIPAGYTSPTTVFLGARDPAPAASFKLIRPAATGVEGDILVGPDVPVCPSTGCPPGKHVQGIVRIETASQTRGGPGGQLVAMVPTDAQGHFTAQIPPGHYLLAVVKDDPGFPIPKPSVIDVEGGVVTQVILLLDTGIR